MNKPKDYAENGYKYQRPEFYGMSNNTPVESNDTVLKLFKKILNRLDKNEEKLKISRISNGFVVEYPNDNDGNFPNKEVFEYDICTEVDKSKIAAMLYQILEWMDVDGGRYDEERIQIRVVHGDKFECKNKKCEICKEGQ